MGGSITSTHLAKLQWEILADRNFRTSQLVERFIFPESFEGENLIGFFSLQSNRHKLVPDVSYVFYMLQFNVVPKKSPKNSMKRDILVNDDLLDPVTWNHDFRTGPRIPRMQCSGTNGSHWWMMGLSPWWMVTKNDLAVPSSASASIWGMEISMIFMVVVSNIVYFTPTWGRFPIWLIFCKWVETTN